MHHLKDRLLDALMGDMKQIDVLRSILEDYADSMHATDPYDSLTISEIRKAATTMHAVFTDIIEGDEE